MDLGILVPILGGYWFLWSTRLNRYRLLRQSGYHLFFHSALIGFGFYVIGWLQALSLRRRFPCLDAWLEQAQMPFLNFDAVVLGLLIAFFSAWSLNLLTKWRRLGRKYEAVVMRDHGELVDWFLRDAMAKGSLVELTLKSGKSYVGLITDRGGTMQNNADIGLVPVLSGYRDQATQKMEITTNYASLISQCGKEGGDFEHLSADRLKLFLPSREIVSAREFDPKVASHFGHRFDDPNEEPS